MSGGASNLSIVRHYMRGINAGAILPCLRTQQLQRSQHDVQNVVTYPTFAATSLPNISYSVPEPGTVIFVSASPRHPELRALRPDAEGGTALVQPTCSRMQRAGLEQARTLLKRGSVACSVLGLVACQPRGGR
jgi:hypothetical protein